MAQSASGDLRTGIDKVVTSAHDAADRAADTAHRVVDKVASGAAPVADWATENVDKLKESQDRLLSSVEQYVRDHPWKALGGALAFGFVLSRALR